MAKNDIIEVTGERGRAWGPPAAHTRRPGGLAAERDRPEALLGRPYSPDELEFLLALDSWKRRHRRPFPTCVDVLNVLKGLGYSKVPEPAQPPPQDEAEALAGLLLAEEELTALRGMAAVL